MEKALWIESKSFPFCSTTVPTRGACCMVCWSNSWWFWGSGTFASSGSPFSFREGWIWWGNGKFSGWASGTCNGYPGGLVDLQANRRRLVPGSTGVSSTSFAKTVWECTQDVLDTFLLAANVLAKRWPNIWVYISEYEETFKLLPVAFLKDPAKWECSWSWGHRKELKYWNIIWDVVNTCVPFWRAILFTGCFKLPAVHRSHRAR